MPSELAETEIKEIKAELISLYRQYKEGIDAYLLLDSQGFEFAQEIKKKLESLGLLEGDLREIRQYFFTNPEGFGFTYTVEELANLAEDKRMLNRK